MRIDDFQLGRPLAPPGAARGPASWPAAPQAGEPGAPEASFGEVLQQAIKDVNQASVEAEQAVKSLAAGESGDIHGTMIEVKKADASFQMMMQVRNKLLDAYREVMRMGV